ncbi:MAG: MiaB/RimO family radical SAM methylthiotransferase [Gemmatimonadaceae bacterium]|nr:MiaB/RimO family radical SAM methylthiotransferase [Gemmatimonadaceae bacterium]
MKLLLRTFGCRANQYDSEAVRAMVRAAGGELVDDAAEADVALFNSCAVTAGAEAELRREVRRTAGRNASLRTVIMGCASALERSSGDLDLRTLPTVVTLVAGADLNAVGRALGISAPSTPPSQQSGARALLRIQDGCDEHCTFCTTVLARGRNRSRDIDALVEEAARLADHHTEIVLTGVHIGSYGTDAGSSLSALLDRLVAEVPAARFRLSSLEATEVDPSLADRIVARDGHVASYLHAPLQSGSDRVLKRMGRHWYSATTYARAIERLAARQSVLGLGADVITGFPGEDEDDHRATVALVRALPFTALHVFPWSARPGTSAERLAGRVAPEVARARALELRSLASDKAERYRAGRAGGAADIVVIRDGDRREGLTEDYLSVALGNGAPRRGARFHARLASVGGTLTAHAVTVSP